MEEEKENLFLTDPGESVTDKEDQSPLITAETPNSPLETQEDSQTPQEELPNPPKESPKAQEDPQTDILEKIPYNEEEDGEKTEEATFGFQNGENVENSGRSGGFSNVTTGKRNKTVVEEEERVYTSTEPGKISILNFEMECADDIPQFTEEATIMAMSKLAIEQRHIKKIVESDLKDYAQFPEVKKKAESLLSKRREALIKSIKDEREIIIQKRAREIKVPVEKTSRSQQVTEEQLAIQEHELKRVENLQKREIVQLIVGELVREQTIVEETERQKRRDARATEIEEENKKLNEIELKKRKEKEELMRQKIMEQKERLYELQKKQAEEMERNQILIQERREKQLKALTEAEALRQQKAVKQREMLEKQMEAERQKVIEKQKEQVKRDLLLEQRRIQQYNSIKERNARAFSEQREKFELSLKKQQEIFHNKVLQMEKREHDSVIRVQTTRQKLIQKSEDIRAKSQQQVSRHSDAMERLREREKSRIEHLASTNSMVEARRMEILQQKLEKMKIESSLEKKKREKIEIVNAEKAEKMRCDVELIMIEWDKDQKRAQEQKDLRDKEIQQRMTLQKLKDKIRDENAERVSKINEIKIKEKSEVAKERSERAILYVHSKQVIANKKREASVELQFKKQSVQEEFNELLRRGGKLDIDGLAKKFNIDVEELRRKVAQSRKKDHTEKNIDNESVSHVENSTSPENGYQLDN